MEPRERLQQIAAEMRALFRWSTLTAEEKQKLDTIAEEDKRFTANIHNAAVDAWLLELDRLPPPAPDNICTIAYIVGVTPFHGRCAHELSWPLVVDAIRRSFQPIRPHDRAALCALLEQWLLIPPPRRIDSLVEDTIAAIKLTDH